MQYFDTFQEDLFTFLNVDIAISYSENMQRGIIYSYKLAREVEPCVT